MNDEKHKEVNWKAWYWGSILFLVAQIIIYYLITASF